MTRIRVSNSGGFTEGRTIGRSSSGGCENLLVGLCKEASARTSGSMLPSDSFFLNECEIKRLKWVEEDVSMSMVAFDWQVSYISFLLVFKSDHRSTMSS